MARFGFVGDDYKSYESAASCQQTMNWYPEVVARDGGKSTAYLCRVPGIKVIVGFGQPGCRGVYTEPKSGRVFTVMSGFLFELTYIAGVWAYVLFGALNSASTMAHFSSNGFSLAVVSGRQLYTVDLMTNTFEGVVPGLDITQIDFLGGYLIGVNGGTTFFISDLYKARTWSGNEASAEDNPDAIVGLKVDHGRIWLGGTESTEIWASNGGNVDFPFDRIQGTTMTEGWVSPDCAVSMDNTLFWISQSKNGSRMAMMANGYTPTRISNYSIEAEWQSYATISDAVAFPYQENGHTFWVISFPNAMKTWVYDRSNAMWHQRGYWNRATGLYESVRGRYHCFGYGQHIVGDWQFGSLYIQSLKYLTDDDFGFIRRVRRSPHVWSDNKRNYFNGFELYVQAGVGVINDPQGDAIFSLRWSDDGGKTWSSFNDRNAGELGQYSTRVRWLRLGSGRDRVWEVVTTAAADVVMIDADIIVTQGFS